MTLKFLHQTREVTELHIKTVHCCQQHDAYCAILLLFFLWGDSCVAFFLIWFRAVRFELVRYNTICLEVSWSHGISLIPYRCHTLRALYHYLMFWICSTFSLYPHYCLSILCSVSTPYVVYLCTLYGFTSNNDSVWLSLPINSYTFTYFGGVFIFCSGRGQSWRHAFGYSAC